MGDVMIKKLYKNFEHNYKKYVTFTNICSWESTRKLDSVRKFTSEIPMDSTYFVHRSKLSIFNVKENLKQFNSEIKELSYFTPLHHFIYLYLQGVVNINYFKIIDVRTNYKGKVFYSHTAYIKNILRLIPGLEIMKNSINRKYEQFLAISFEDITSGNECVYIFSLLYDKDSRIYFVTYHDDKLEDYIIKHAYK